MSGDSCNDTDKLLYFFTLSGDTYGNWMDQLIFSGIGPSIEMDSEMLIKNTG